MGKSSVSRTKGAQPLLHALFGAETPSGTLLAPPLRATGSQVTAYRQKMQAAIEKDREELAQGRAGVEVEVTESARVDLVVKILAVNVLAVSVSVVNVFAVNVSLPTLPSVVSKGALYTTRDIVSKSVLRCMHDM